MLVLMGTWIDTLSFDSFQTLFYFFIKKKLTPCKLFDVRDPFRASSFVACYHAIFALQVYIGIVSLWNVMNVLIF